ncbi:pectinesterase-like [Nymphaea colorata]|nr:pectinesterase-like [Nymphaea colorata]
MVRTTNLLFLVLMAASVWLFLPARSLHLEEEDVKAASSACDGTLYPDLCLSTLSTLPGLSKRSLQDMICHIIEHAEKDVEDSSSNCASIFKAKSGLDFRQKTALQDCQELFSDTLSQLTLSVADLRSALSSNRSEETMALLSAAMTNQYTCLEGFDYSSGSVRNAIQNKLYNVTKLVSNSLSLTTKVKPGQPGATTSVYTQDKDGFPSWLSAGDRKLLQASAGGIKANVVVAKDGSGQFTTVSAAVAAAPSGSKGKYVIYIKAGTYQEAVNVPRGKTNLMFVGDGIGQTVITGSRNVQDGWTTFRSATVGVAGNGFVARDITFQNTAGPSKHQAVALRVGSDLSAFYRCSFVGYQDTLYVHSLRQFYRECEIYGTVDFIFGNAAVVFQGCSIYARRPNPSQSNTFTAQGRQDPNQNTGISIQNCKLAAASDLAQVQSNFKTYLGRPWQAYSRTVVMQSEIDGLVDPAGWLPWSGSFALSTLFYGEYLNRGAGAGTAKRVTWPGYRVITSASVASQFTVQNFIVGSAWLGATGVPFSAGL